MQNSNFMKVMALIGVAIATFLESVAALDIETYVDETTVESTHRPPTTPKATLGPNDLTSTDYIIIGVTSAVGAFLLVGGVIFCCRQRNQEENEKEKIYNRYLYQDQLDSQQGKTNTSFVA